jgi:oligopeptide transport system substrate-binding protein
LEPSPQASGIRLWFAWRDYRFVFVLLLLPLAIMAGVIVSATRGQRADLVFCNGDEPETVDPALVTTMAGGRIVYALFEGLTVYDPRTRRVVPGVAAGWDVSQDGRTYTFRLRSCRWSNGDAVTAGDFVYSWRRVIRPETAARYAGILSCIDGADAVLSGKAEAERMGVEAPDERTLRVRLSAPTPHFPELTAFMTFLPVHRGCVERHGRGWTRPENMVCNGAFRLARWDINRRIVLARNGEFHDLDRVLPGRIEALTVSDRNTQLNFYLTGISDILVGVPPSLVQVLEGRDDFHVCPSFETYFYRFNVSRTDHVLADPRVRRALHMAIDREQICRYVTRGGQRPALTLVPPGVPDYARPAGVPEDVSAANRLLDEAGFRDRSRFPTLTLLFNTSGFHRDIAEVVQRMWQENLGIRVELKNMEFRTFMQRCRSLEYEVSRGGWSGDYFEPSTFLDCFRGGSGNNRTGWSEGRYDALLDRAALAADRRERYGLYAAAEALLVREQMPIMPIYFGVNQRMWKPHVRGMTADPMGLVMLRFISVSR